MRLVEAADLEKFIRENVCTIGDDHLLLVAGDDGRWHEALPLVKTAYSVDRVVDELEKKRDKLSEEGCCLSAKQINEAIKIVKAGGNA